MANADEGADRSNVGIPNSDEAQRAALDALAGAEHLGDLHALIAGRKLGEALARLAPLDPDIEKEIASALALVGVPYGPPDTAQSADEPRSLADVLRADDDVDLDAALVEARAATDAGRRTDLDDAIRALGHDRVELEAENVTDAITDAERVLREDAASSAGGVADLQARHDDLRHALRSLLSALGRQVR